MTTRWTAISGFSLFVLLEFAAGGPVSAETRRAFVTSTSGSGNLFSWAGSSGATSLARGDSICQARALAAGLPNPATYRAWLSTSTTDAYCHVQGLSGKKATGCGGAALPGGGPWYLVNGVSNFTGTLDQLVGTERVLYRPVLFDENGDEASADTEVWTGSSANGTVSTGATCNDWASGSAASTGLQGRSNHSAVHWTQYIGQPCDNHARLLCLEPGPSESRGLAWTPGVIVFATSMTGPGNLSSWPEALGETGVAAADQVCRTAATLAALPQPEGFVAWISDSGVDAADRVTVTGPLRRLDGYTVAGSLAALLDHPINSIHVDENRQYLASQPGVFTGTNADGTADPSTCSNWTTSSSGSFAGLGRASAGRTGLWTDAGATGCHQEQRLYCFHSTVTTELALFADGFEIGSASRWSATIGD
jgi:hypothetical protein